MENLHAMMMPLMFLMCKPLFMGVVLLASGFVVKHFSCNHKCVYLNIASMILIVGGVICLASMVYTMSSGHNAMQGKDMRMMMHRAK